MKKKKTVRFLGIPFYKIREKDGVRKKYFLGICYNKKISNQNVVLRTVEQTDEGKQEILIVNSDSIGDYILYRNFLREIKNSEKYRDYRLVLLGCETYKSFAEYLDSDIVDQFFWVPNRPENLDVDELEKVKIDLHDRQGMKHYYDTIVFSSFNSMPKREAHEFLVSDITCKNNIIHCDATNRSRNCMEMLNYTYIYMSYKGRENFDFQNNKDFYEDLLQKKIDLKFPHIEEEKVIFQYEALHERKSEYIVINPCAYDCYRMWHRNNWAQIIRYLKNEKGYDVFIVCSKKEQAYCQQLADDLNLAGVNVLAGLSVQHLLSVLKLAKMYIGQDSGVFHVAAALNIRALCLSAGNAYFRFMNYPKERRNIKVLFPLGAEEWINENNKKYPLLVRDVNAFYINSIRVDKVKEQIDELLSKDNNLLGVVTQPIENAEEISQGG